MSTSNPSPAKSTLKGFLVVLAWGALIAVGVAVICLYQHFKWHVAFRAPIAEWRWYDWLAALFIVAGIALIPWIIDRRLGRKERQK